MQTIEAPFELERIPHRRGDLNIPRQARQGLVIDDLALVRLLGSSIRAADLELVRMANNNFLLPAVQQTIELNQTYRFKGTDCRLRVYRVKGSPTIAISAPGRKILRDELWFKEYW